MTLRRWRRIATGLAAGVIVLCAALLGASLRGDNTSVSVASESRVATSVPTTTDEAESGDSTGPVRVIEVQDLPDETATSNADTTTNAAADDNDASTAVDASDANADVTTADSDAAAGDQSTSADSTSDADAETNDNGDAVADGSGETGETGETEAATPPAPLTADEGALGTGGGVDDAECALDRLVVYGGARVGGVGAGLRDAIVQSGFGTECAEPVAVLASNCPLQFSGVLGADSGYDPQQSFVAASANVDRETLSAVLGELGYSGSEIDILAFSFSEPTPNETWIAVFVPPSFSGWQALADRAGISPTDQSLCAPSGQLAG